MYSKVTGVGPWKPASLFLRSLGGGRLEPKKTGRRGEALLSQLFFEPFSVDINTFVPLSKEEKEIKTIFIIICILTASYATEHKENSTLHREVKKGPPLASYAFAVCGSLNGWHPLHICQPVVL